MGGRWEGNSYISPISPISRPTSRSACSCIWSKAISAYVLAWGDMREIWGDMGEIGGRCSGDTGEVHGRCEGDMGRYGEIERRYGEI